MHLYQEHGMDAILQLKGMFAFALWDENKQRLWLGRDRLGIKPLVYAETACGIAFASTLDAITLLPGFNKQIDQDSLMLYLSLSYVPTPRSIFSGIKKLAPGHWLCYENSTIKIKKYWSIQPKDKKMSDREFSGTLDDLIKDSIRLRSRSDVPVGTLLSGGIDSSSVTAYYCEDQAGGVHTFLADFEGKDSDKKPKKNKFAVYDYGF